MGNTIDYTTMIWGQVENRCLRIGKAVARNGKRLFGRKEARAAAGIIEEVGPTSIQVLVKCKGTFSIVVSRRCSYEFDASCLTLH